MANFNFSVASGVTPAMSSAITYFNSAVVLQPTTSTPLVTLTFSSVDRIDDPYAPVELGIFMTGLSKAIAMNTPRRPSGGQLYPRGNQ
ncbi:hypothetical protein EB001_01020 [bacterium]|nr:hypothetical protein [bacterium]